MHGSGIRQYYAGSSETFGDSNGESCSETTPFKPRSPYAVGKASAFWLADNYRDAYGLFACTGILFNHESPLRPARFVTKKIINAAKRIAEGSNETLELGRLDIVRDWGWAPKYVEAMWLMLQQERPEDFVIATGVSHSLQEFVASAFDSLGLDWRQHVIQSPKFMRPTDIAFNRGDPSKAKRMLGWDSEIDMHGVIQRMIEGSLQ
jgi:GDPmannose 4,6-dehydratase